VTGGADGEGDLQACPVCSAKLPPAVINAHLDSCLAGGGGSNGGSSGGGAPEDWGMDDGCDDDLLAAVTAVETSILSTHSSPPSTPSSFRPSTPSTFRPSTSTPSTIRTSTSTHSATTTCSTRNPFSDSEDEEPEVKRPRDEHVEGGEEHGGGGGGGELDVTSLQDDLDLLAALEDTGMGEEQEASMFACPVCQALLNHTVMNAHLDSCLS